MSEPSRGKDLWWRIRGEIVGLIGLLGMFLIEWGEALDRWSVRHFWAKGEYDYLARMHDLDDKTQTNDDTTSTSRD